MPKFSYVEQKRGVKARAARSAGPKLVRGAFISSLAQGSPLSASKHRMPTERRFRAAGRRASSGTRSYNRKGELTWAYYCSSFWFW